MKLEEQRENWDAKGDRSWYEKVKPSSTKTRLRAAFFFLLFCYLFIFGAEDLIQSLIYLKHTLYQ
jgi:hypothetical protein